MKTVEDLEKQNEILKLKLRIAELEKELEHAKETIKEESKRPFISPTKDMNSGYKKINTLKEEFERRDLNVHSIRRVIKNSLEGISSYANRN